MLKSFYKESISERSPCHQQGRNTEKTLMISVDDRKIPFQDSDKTVLNCLEKSDVEVHYHCRDGFCGACRVTLVEGEIHYPNGEPLAFVGDSEILPCCCVPKSNIKVFIE